MATTTNYGWTTPDDTSLVKDGAAAIRTLGSSIDTTTKALNPSTTLGDLEYRSATANTNTRLAIGSTGNVLTVSGGVPVWAAPAAGGGMTLLSTTSMSGSATITLSSINQTYKDLVVLINNTTWDTGESELRLLFNNSNVACGTGRFGASEGNFENDNLKFTLSLNTNNTIAQTHYCLIKNYASTTAFKPFEVSGTAQVTTGNPRGSVIGGAARTTSAISSLVITTANTHNFNAGTILLYGVN